MHSDNQAAYVATRHYVDGISRIEIADELGISRFAVSRLLQRARDRGIVRFVIDAPSDIDTALSEALQERYGLHHAFAVHPPGETPDLIRQSLGRVAAKFLSDTITPADVLGIAAGRTLNELGAAVTELPEVDIVQLGGVATDIQESGVQLVRRIAQVSRGAAYPLLAPLLTQNAETAQLLRKEPAIDETIAQFSRVTVAVVGVGSWDPPDSQVYLLVKRLGQLEELLQRGVCAEIGAITLDHAGNEVPLLRDQAVGIDSQTLRRVPEVIAVAGGSEKTRAVSAALQSGLITSLVCDTGTARALLTHHHQETHEKPEVAQP